MSAFSSLKEYFKGVNAEMKKVVWPSFPTLTRYFFSVVIGISLATVFIWAVDYIFIHLISLIVK